MAFPNRPSIEEIRRRPNRARRARNGSSRKRESITAARRFTLRVSSHTSSSMVSTLGHPGNPGGVDEATQGPETRCRTVPPPPPPPAVSATSTTDQWAADPMAVTTQAAVSSAPSASMSHTATGRPTSARARAVSRPIPEPPPVTSTPVPGEPRRSRAGPGGAGHVLSPTLGWTPGSICDRSGLAWSRSDSTGSTTPQSASMAGSFQATPEFVVGVVVVVDQVPQREIGERGEAVGHTRAG